MPAPDDIPQRWGEVDLVTALSVARDLPDDALDMAAEKPGRIAPAVLEVAAKAADGQELTERETNLLFWGLFVLGHARETALCPVLLRLLALSDEQLYGLFGEAVALGAMPRLLVSVFDGEAEPLLSLLADPKADEMVRMSLFGAAARLTHEGRIPAERMRAFIRDFDRTRPIRAGDAGWHGWEAAIAYLGLSDLIPLVDFAYDDARLLGDWVERGWCAEVCRETADPLRRDALFEAEELIPLGHPADEADTYLALEAEGEAEEAEGAEPAQNPLREVGRNDPCPCGSGKKFKKCCLAVQ